MIMGVLYLNLEGKTVMICSVKDTLCSWGAMYNIEIHKVLILKTFSNTSL